MNANTTQLCKKCKQEKALTEFHRRSAGYQRICKSCRKAHIPSGNKRTTHRNEKSVYQALSERIKKIETKLHAKAASYANDPLEADDIYSAMVEEILFKSSPDDSDARILTRATWAAKAYVRSSKAYFMRVATEEQMSSTDDDGEGYAEITASPSLSAEDEFIQREQKYKINKMLKTLPEKYQNILYMLSLGHNQREIAHEFGKSDQEISSAIKNIAKQLQSLGLSQSFSFA
jgi:RNA polymerase sigma factor (sigma-70 family)